MTVKPLAELMAQADRFINGGSVTKVASPAAVSTDLGNFAEQLISAGAVETEYDSEKVAVALNKAAASVEIESLKKIEQFEDLAIKSGFTKEQVNEALEKVSAAHTHRTLKLLVSDAATVGGLDVNTLKKKPVPAKTLGQAPTEHDTTNLGYAK